MSASQFVSGQVGADVQLKQWLLGHSSQQCGDPPGGGSISHGVQPTHKIPVQAIPAPGVGMGMPLPVQIVTSHPDGTPRPPKPATIKDLMADDVKSAARAYLGKQGPALDDNLIWCDECGRGTKSLCKAHQPWFQVKDRVIPSRAKLTAPHFVVVRTIELRAGADHVYGVFAKKVVQKRTQFGPYEGKLLDKWLHDRNDRIKLKIFDDCGVQRYLDCTDQGVCNWMMFVRPASSVEEQNLVAYQYKGQIYFCTTKAIPQNGELRVWYACQYAACMGEKAYRPPNKPQTQHAQTSDQARDTVSSGARGSSMVTVKTSEDKDDRKEFPAPSRPHLRRRRGEAKPRTPTRAPSGGKVGRHSGDSTEEVSNDENDVDCEEDRAEHIQNDNQADIMEPQAEPLREESVPCGECGEMLSSANEMEAHSCDEVPPLRIISEDTQRPVTRGKSRSKRKGLPVKLDSGKMVKAGTRLRPLPTTKIKDSATVIKLRKRAKHVKRSVDKLSLKRKHKSSKAPGELHTCGVCNKAFSTQQKLTIHGYTHTGEKPFKCDVENCTRGFVTKFKLIRHQLVHTESRQHPCPYCEKAFGRKDHLKNHLKIHDPNKEMRQCEQCGKEYASSFAFRTHLAIHAAESGDLTCGVCKAEFKNREDIMNHLKMHAGARSTKDGLEKNQVCPMCNKRFFTKKDIRRHLVVHSRERDFLCQYCPHSFGRKDHLVRHLKRSHRAELPPGNVTDAIQKPGKVPQTGSKYSKAVSENAETVTNMLQTVTRYMSDSAAPGGQIGNHPGQSQTTFGTHQSPGLGGMVIQNPTNTIQAVNSVQAINNIQAINSIQAVNNLQPIHSIQSVHQPMGRVISATPTPITYPAPVPGYVQQIPPSLQINNMATSLVSSSNLPNPNQINTNLFTMVNPSVGVGTESGVHNMVSAPVQSTYMPQFMVAPSTSVSFSHSLPPGGASIQGQPVIGSLQPTQLSVVENPQHVPVLLNPDQSQGQVRAQAATSRLPTILRRPSARPLARVPQPPPGGSVVPQLMAPPAGQGVSTTGAVFPTLIVSYADAMKLCIFPEDGAQQQQQHAQQQQPLQLQPQSQVQQHQQSQQQSQLS